MSSTNEATTNDWLDMSKGMALRGYDGSFFPSKSQTSQKQEEPIGEPIFGANIKDAISITREWLASRD